MGTINGIAYVALQPILIWWHVVPGWMVLAFIAVAVIFGLKFIFK